MFDRKKPVENFVSRYGIDGNDMVLIDRSISGGEKHYIGSSTTKLSISYDYETDTLNRLNGHRKHVEGKSACFARFSTKQINKTERSVEATATRTEHTRTSKAVAKKHVITEEIFSQANEFFEAQDLFLIGTCEQTTNARDNAEDEDEEAEATENVTEEVVVLRQRDESQVAKYTPESERKIRSKITPQNLIKQIKHTSHRGTIRAISQNIFDLFSIEVPIKLLETVSLHTIYQKNCFYRFATVCSYRSDQ